MATARHRVVRLLLPALLAAGLALAFAAVAGGCTCAGSRAECVRDGDCGDEQVCYLDGRCVPRDVAERLGATVGDECVVSGGVEIGCAPDEICRMGWCDGEPADGSTGDGDAGGDASMVNCTAGSITDPAPLFGGVTDAIADGSDAVVLTWIAAADDTPPAAITYHVFMAESAGGQDFTTPQVSVVGQSGTRIDGLTTGTTYHFVVRAEDGAGQIECNTAERSATPQEPGACIDYATQVQPIFTGNCIGCHSGGGAPQGLRLDSYAGVMAGGASGNTIVACQPAASLLYLKISMADPPVGERMPKGGPYLVQPLIDTIGAWIATGARSDCSQPDPCSDAVPPAFAGLATATAVDATRAELCWTAASDDVSAPADLLYDAYLSTSSGGQTFTAPPRRTSAAGATCMVVDALSPATQYCFVVRARDQAGNRDANTVERCLTMPALPPGCVDYDTMVQPLLDHNCTRCHAGARPPQWLRLDDYDAVLAGSARRNTVMGCNSAASYLVGKVSASPPVGRRMPYDGPPYLTTQQVALLAQWVDQGAPRSCPAPGGVCSDGTAPAFAGAVTATATDATTIRVCWSAAADGVTPAADLRYDLYQSTVPAGESYGLPANQTVTGDTCVDVRVGPGTSMCFVVRVRDLAGNRDGNTVEVCATTPAAACGVDYAQLIQPIFSARCTHCHSDDASPRHLDLRSHAGALAGGAIRTAVRACDWPGSLIEDKTAGNACGARMPRDGPPWLAPAERSLLAHWMNTGARAACSDPDPCADVTPPAFAGAGSAVEVDATTARICWSAAVDATTPAGSVVYELYDSIGPGGQDFARKAPYAVAGATCAQVRVPMGVNTCFVVRARDLAWNRDGNGVERCVTTSGACFDYDRTIQPIFDARCVHCHSGASPPRGIDWSSYTRAIANDEVGACDVSGSKMLQEVGDCTMPYDTTFGTCRACLTSAQVRLMRQWTAAGAPADCPWGNCP